MSTTFVTGRGSALSISTDGTTYTPVLQIKTTQYSGSKGDMEDVTSMSSPGATREWAPTLLDSGQLACSGVFSPADPGQLMLGSAFAAQQLVYVKHQYAPAAGQTTGFLRSFKAYVTDHNLDLQFDKAGAFSSTLKITGLITDVAGS